MKREIILRALAEQHLRTVDVQQNGDAWLVTIEGHPTQVDAVQIAPYTYSVLLHDRSYELRVTPMPDGSLKIQSATVDFAAHIVDPREWQGRHAASQAEGRQVIAAPMPGKVVRVLVALGEKVEAGQGLVVVEAMKMQNEIRSPKSGIVEKIAAVEGQAVNSGDVLLWVD